MRFLRFPVGEDVERRFSSRPWVPHRNIAETEEFLIWERDVGIIKLHKTSNTLDVTVKYN
jgi:hypothetical protein